MNRDDCSVRRLVLASASPRRRSLLADAGYAFVTKPSHIHEPVETLEHLSPVELAEMLSFLKASSVAGTVQNATVLGADTVVACHGAIFGKAADADDARRILRTLMNEPHEVITGVTLLDADTDRRETASAVTRVTMNPMSPAQLDAYIAGGQWQGKAGAYGIQDHGDEFVQKLDGSFSNVVGLPMELISAMLERWGHLPAHRRDGQS